jgi:hypothetical protein
MNHVRDNKPDNAVPNTVSERESAIPDGCKNLSVSNGMKLSKEKKFFTAVLLFYWLGLIVATHIPVPTWVRGMGVSDKTMHVAAYMVLTLLVWLAFFFDIKANWRKFQPWLVLIFILLHGILDELTQHFIAGRSTDPADLCADMLGAAVAMIIVTFISGYNATMILTAVTPVFLPAIVKSKIIKQDSIIEIFIYAIVFAIITGVWIQYLSIIKKLDCRKFKYLPIYMAGPAAVLTFVKIYAVITNKPFENKIILCSLLSIIITQLIGRFIVNHKSSAI